MLRLNDWFCGAGGATQGAHAVPGITPVLAANHNELAIATHSANFPDVEHYQGDIRDVDVAGHPYAEIFWASPECTNWSKAKGKVVDFDKQPGLFGDEEIAEDVARSRALMQDVVRYLRGMHLRQQPVLAGVVENVVDVRKWEHWHIWRTSIEQLGYRTRLIALNSMHAAGPTTPRAPQSRDRLYLAYWHESLRRDPDWDKWLRPAAWCPTCEETVAAVQVWKRPGVDMGKYRQQYTYRCPRVSCRGRVVEPEFVPATAVIDWTLPGQRIGDRPLKEFFDKKTKKSLGWHHMAPKTLTRIGAGARRHARPVVVEAGGHQYDAAPTGSVVVPPMLVPAGGTWNDTAALTSAPLRTRTTRQDEGILMPPLLVPVEGREGKTATTTSAAMRTQTARNETGLLIPPMIAELRGGGSTARPTREALATVTASGNHHGLVIPPLVMRNNGSKGSGAEMCTPAGEELRTITTAGHQSLLTWGYAYDSGLTNLAEALPTQTTVQGDALLTAAEWDALVEDCLFRMLEPHEIHAGMAFVPDYIVLGNKRDQVRQLGNAVTPPVAEVLISALVETITGQPLPHPADTTAVPAVDLAA
ncbi:DNA cytosine methyltransferase [Myceligenerans halotolerans]